MRNIKLQGHYLNWLLCFSRRTMLSPLLVLFTCVSALHAQHSRPRRYGVHRKIPRRVHSRLGIRHEIRRAAPAETGRSVILLQVWVITFHAILARITVSRGFSDLSRFRGSDDRVAELTSFELRGPENSIFLKRILN